MKKTDEKIFQARKLVAKVGALMLRRNLTDLAGGNISMRIGKKVLMSPTLAGTYKFWNIKPEEVLVLDLEGKKLDGYGDISRESTTHLLHTEGQLSILMPEIYWCSALLILQYHLF